MKFSMIYMFVYFYIPKNLLCIREKFYHARTGHVTAAIKYKG
jgi:hypothetical protein